MCMICDSKYVTKDVKCYNSGSLVLIFRFVILQKKNGMRNAKDDDKNTVQFFYCQI